jgi:hypothetical protein
LKFHSTSTNDSLQKKLPPPYKYTHNVNSGKAVRLLL